MYGGYTHSQQQLLFVFFQFWNPMNVSATILCIAFVQLTNETFATDAGRFCPPTPIYLPFTAVTSFHAVT